MEWFGGDLDGWMDAWIYYNIITLLSATILQLKSFKTFLKL
jgi:hypothetical protein